MAFASTVLRNGVSGEWKTLWGTWTGTAGDSNGSFDTGGSFVKDAKFFPNVTSGPSMPVAVSGLGTEGSGTVTVYNHETVTVGTFEVVYK